MGITQVKRFFIGEPLSNQQLSEEKIPKWKALAVLSSDALSSVAYATEEILIPLAAFAVAATAWSIPIALAIVTLLVIVSVSYRQVIEAYQDGGGAYVVAKENLGTYPGLVAGASLLIDYVLTVAVSVAAGVSAITSAFPELVPFKIGIGAGTIVILTFLNLRGIRESATVFAYPTYLFIISYVAMLGYGTLQIMTGQARAVEPVFAPEYMAVPTFLLLRAFASGCAALTGIEAISNGVPAFRHPAAHNAKITLAWMVGILFALFFGITAVSHVYGIAPAAGETAVSQLARAIFGVSPFYYLIQFSTAMILFLAANTSYNGFPWLASALARDRFLPRQMAILGDRLVFSNSIIWLSMAAITLLWLFDSEPHALIPLYATGVFMGFTLSQTGMLRFHLRNRQPGWTRSFAINLVGAITTFMVMTIVAVTKFTHGAWIVLILIPVLVLLFTRIYTHYISVGDELTLTGVDAPEHLRPCKHTVLVPLSGVHRGVIDALRYAISISDDVRAVYVEITPEATERMRDIWDKWGHDIPFVALKSPYRSIIRPFLEYIDDLAQVTPRDMITVVIPEFVTEKWWHQALHNQTALMIRAALMFKRGVVVTSVRYHLGRQKRTGGALA